MAPPRAKITCLRFPSHAGRSRYDFFYPRTYCLNTQTRPKLISQFELALWRQKLPLRLFWQKRTADRKKIYRHLLPAAITCVKLKSLRRAFESLRKRKSVPKVVDRKADDHVWRLLTVPFFRDLRSTVKYVLNTTFTRKETTSCHILYYHIENLITHKIIIAESNQRTVEIIALVSRLYLLSPSKRTDLKISFVKSTINSGRTSKDRFAAPRDKILPFQPAQRAIFCKPRG